MPNLMEEKGSVCSYRPRTNMVIPGVAIGTHTAAEEGLRKYETFFTCPHFFKLMHPTPPPPPPTTLTNNILNPQERIRRH